ncbi:hypothetical protein [Actinokineospora sp.]|uniref:hypothetical protein n=1 Tax=Actinokineospora sp. TaxID=1872133 RepID=UPI003D6A3198
MSDASRRKERPRPYVDTLRRVVGQVQSVEGTAQAWERGADDVDIGDRFALAAVAGGWCWRDQLNADRF